MKFIVLLFWINIIKIVLCLFSGIKFLIFKNYGLYKKFLIEI